MDIKKTESIYTDSIIKKAKGKPCKVCSECITEYEANDKQFIYIKRNNRNELFIHKRCWSKAF